MIPTASHAIVRRSINAALFLAVSASAAAAQGVEVSNGFESLIVTSDSRTGSNQGVNNPLYIADRSIGSDYSGSVVIWLRDAQGGVISACTGSNLGGGKILTAAHCVSDGTSLKVASFTARFNEAGTWYDVDGAGFAVKPGYSGAVVEENDVAVLTLSNPAPSFARTYGLASTNAIGQLETLAGYGMIGTGLTGDVTYNHEFDDSAELLTGKNVFETTCKTGFDCESPLVDPAHPLDPVELPPYGYYGGIYLFDMDQPGFSSHGTLCDKLGFCTAGVSGFQEVGIGHGDSGSASFLSDWTITGVASFAEVNGSNAGGLYGYAAGYTCVANVVGNDACVSNYDFIESQLAPEPASLILMASGLIGVFGVVRRRRRA
jgi:hypothetical protein